MITLESLRNAPVRESTDPVRGAPAAIDRDGGMFGAGLITGASAISRGEALGHGLWIDGEFLGSVAAELSRGDKKVRFRHPGLSSDGLGTVLGKAQGAELTADRVATSIHLLESARTSPDGDLAAYVMDLAEESPDLFGASIVFRSDRQAEDDFATEHGAEFKTDPIWGKYLDFENFESPDDLNTKNLPHARLSRLHAVDVVDDPAANPGGMFSSLDEDGATVEQFEMYLAYALGLSRVRPDCGLIPVDPDRARQFVARFASRRNLDIKEILDNQPRIDKKPSQTIKTHETPLLVFSLPRHRGPS